MTVSEVFDFFRRENVEVGVVDKDLWLDSDPGQFPEAIRLAIGSHKEKIISMIEAEADHQQRLQGLSVRNMKVADASWAQQRLWFLSQMSSGQPAYNICMAYRVRGELDLPALERAVDCLVERHAVLRSVYDVRDNELVQVIKDHVPFRLAVGALDDASQGQADQVASFVSRCATQAFDLTCDLMLRCHVMRLAQGEHVIVFNVHHIAFDGWSASIFFEELKRCYAAFSRHHHFEFDTPAFQYGDFAEWQMHDYGGIRAHEEMAYWEKQLAGSPTLHSLPLDHPRPAVQSYRGARLQRVLKPGVVGALRRLAQQKQCTLFTLMQSVLALLVYRLSARADVSIGVPVANRVLKQIESTIGCFVNTIVMRSTFEPDDTFEAFLASSQTMVNDAFANQDVPFELVVGLINPERSTAHSPLFQIMFDLQTIATGLELEELLIAPEPLAYVVSKFDLCLSAVDKGDTIELLWEYSTDLFKPGRVEVMCDGYEQLIHGILADCSQEVARLPLVGEHQLGIILHERNRTLKVASDNALVSERFERQVALTPEYIALIDQGRMFTYAQLNESANRLALHLRQMGIGCEDVVGLCLERSAQWCIAVLAILKAGGAYLPLDPDLPAERLAFMLNDAKPKAVISHSKHAQLLEGRAHDLVWLDTHEHLIAALPGNDMACPASINSLAYVMYTSGSTGEPKGVLVEQASWLNFIDWIQEKIQLSTDDGLLVKAAIGFDVSALEVIWPLLQGARAVIAPAGAHRSVERLLEIMIEERVSVAQMTPSMLKAVIAHPAWAQVTSMRDLLCGGERLDARLVSAFHATAKDCRLTNFYGPTEATIGASCWHCEVGDGREIIPIGTPMANTQFYILNEAGVPQPDGILGELYIGGAAVARGYLDRPELNLRSFVVNPFVPGGGFMYRTGDLARWNQDAVVEFMGRADQQVKLRGQRLELEEVEKHVLLCPGVQQAVVVVQESAAGGQKLIAYVVATAQSLSSLRAHLLERLPEYMVPTAFVRINELPLTSNGKCDVAALPPVDSENARTQAYASPEGRLEAALCHLLEEILNVRQVGRHDNFFELGGHSILLTLFIQKVRQHYGVTLPLGEIFASMTAAHCAVIIQRLLAVPSQGAVGEAVGRQLQLEGVACSVAGVDLIDRGPASIRQEIMYRQMQGVSPRYRSVYWAYRYEANLDIPRFLLAVRRVVARHLLLRGNLASINGRVRLVEKVRDEQIANFEHRVLEGVHPAQVAEHVAASLADFDLLHDALLRLTLMRMDIGVIAFFSVPHLVFDGYSQQVFNEELALSYQESWYPQADDSFVAFSIDQRKALAGERYQLARRFWREMLGDIWMNRHCTLKVARAEGDIAGSGQVSRPLGVVQVVEAARALQVTAQIIYSFAFGIAVQALHAGEKISFRIHTDGRDRPHVESTVGFLSNTVYLVVAKSEETSLRRRFEEYYQTYVTSLAHQEFPGDIACYLMPEEPRVNFVFKYSQQQANEHGAEMLGQRLSGRSEYFSRIDRFYNPSLDVSLIIQISEGQGMASIYYPLGNLGAEQCECLLDNVELIVSGLVREVLAEG